MVVVTSLGPPEEGVRHTQPAVATYVNRCGEGDATEDVAFDVASTRHHGRDQSRSRIL
jgi:hypothetical protein